MSRWKRLASLGGLTSRVTASYVGARVKQILDPDAATDAVASTQVHNAEQIAATLSQLKGAAMKLGQQLANAAVMLDLPPEVSRSLARLHKDAAPVPFADIRAAVEASLEGPLTAHFATFDEIPLGTASLGQAHAATLSDGRAIVVKVLHSGVREAVDTDLLAVRAILLSGRALRRDRGEVEAAFGEIRERLLEELDYLQEAANIEQFVDAFSRHEVSRSVRLPRLVHALCTDRVLTMERVQGMHLDAFLEVATPQARQNAGTKLAELYYLQLFDLQMLHADPHPGNYLFLEDGSVGMVDFGCVKRFDASFMGVYAKAALAALEGDRDTLVACCYDLGSWNGSDLQDAELLWTFADALCTGFRGGPRTLGPDHERFMEDLRPVLAGFVRRPSVKIPKDVLLAHRSLGGLYAIHRQLGTRADFGAILSRHAAVAVARARDFGG